MNLASSREPAFGVEETRLRGFLHQLVRDRTPMEVGCEYMAARFRVSIWVYGGWRTLEFGESAQNDASDFCEYGCTDLLSYGDCCNMRRNTLPSNALRRNGNSMGF